MTEKKHKTEKLSAFGEMEIEATAAGSVPALPKGKTISGFREALAKNWPDFDPLVPEHVSKETLKAAMIEAVCQNPQLLLCDSRSLFSALKKCAKDGLMPDGREGVITPYKGEAAWNPMVGGLRKRARELDDIIVDADVVCANDQFAFVGGDTPSLTHCRPPLGHERGAFVGAFAIFRKGDRILHREVMDVHEIEMTRKQSRMPDSLMWSKFTGEAYKKVVVRRGFKSVPCSPRLEEIVRREDELFDFEEEPKALEARVVARIAALANEIEAGLVEMGADAKEEKPKRKAKARAVEPSAKKEAKVRQVTPPESVLALRTLMFKMRDAAALKKLWAEKIEPREFDEKEMGALRATFEDVLGRCA